LVSLSVTWFGDRAVIAVRIAGIVTKLPVAPAGSLAPASQDPRRTLGKALKVRLPDAESNTG